MEYDADPFQALGISRSLSPARARKIYKQLCLQHHPDKAAKDPISQEKANQKFADIQANYEKIQQEHKVWGWTMEGGKSSGTTPTAGGGGAYHHHNFSHTHSTASGSASSSFFNYYANKENYAERDPYAGRPRGYNPMYVPQASSGSEPEPPVGVHHPRMPSSTNPPRPPPPPKANHTGMSAMGARGHGRWNAKAESTNVFGNPSTRAGYDNPLFRARKRTREEAMGAAASSTSGPGTKNAHQDQHASKAGGNPASSSSTSNYNTRNNYNSGIPGYQRRDESNLRDEYKRPGPRNEDEEERELDRDEERHKQQNNQRAREMRRMTDKEAIRKKKRNNDITVKLCRLRARIMGAKFVLIPYHPHVLDAMVVPGRSKNGGSGKHAYTRKMARNNLKVSNEQMLVSESLNYPEMLVIEDRSTNGTSIDGLRIMPGADDQKKCALAKPGSMVSIGLKLTEKGASRNRRDLQGNEFLEDDCDGDHLMNMWVEYTGNLGRFERTEVESIFNQLEKTKYTKDMLSKTGLAREIRYWADNPVIQRKDKEISERAQHIFDTWREQIRTETVGTGAAA